MNKLLTLNRVWAVDSLGLPRIGAPTEEETVKWSHLRGINFPIIQSDEVLVLIGYDIPKAHWV